MGVDTSLQYNGYNSYKFNQNDFLICYPFGVENMEYITHSFGAYSPIGLGSKVRAKTRFFNAEGEEIKLENHSFAVQQGTFDKVEITVSVPALAVKAELTFLNNETQPWWVATPKTEEGQNATSYAINAYGQLTYITPNGIYTGTLTANQIVLASGDESLSDRLVTINDRQISVEEDLDTTLKEGVSYAGSRITAQGGFENTAIINGQEVKVVANAQEGFSIYADDKYVGGLKVINGELSLIANKIGLDENQFAGIANKVGSPLELYDLTTGLTPYFSVQQLYNINGDNIGFTILDKNGTERISMSIWDITINDEQGSQRLFTNDTITRIDSPDRNTHITVENGEIFFRVNGVIKETWT